MTDDTDSLQTEIKDTLVSDDESILQANLEDVDGILQIHQDGTVDIDTEYRGADSRDRILIYFVGQRYAMEGGLAESDTLSTSFFYDRLDKKDRTVRSYLQDLREAGYIKKEGQSEHRLVVEKVPDILSRLEEGSSK